MIIELRRITPNYAELFSRIEQTLGVTQLLTAFVFSTSALEHEFGSAAHKDLARRVVGVIQRKGNERHEGNRNQPNFNVRYGPVGGLAVLRQLGTQEPVQHLSEREQVGECIGGLA